MTDVNGQKPFEGDSFIPQEILKLKERFEIMHVVETGSQYGSTLEWFHEHFVHAVGCEPNYEFYKIPKAKELFVFNELSLPFLSNYIEHQIWKPRTLIYIDSHWHDTPCPLKDELKALSKFELPPIICIHDFKVPGKDFGFDIYDYELCFEEIKDLLPDIYPNGYEYHYNTEADGAYRGIIYIYPKL